MSTKFEQLLDYLVNEEMDKANELFHEIVVEKSREIYENLIAQEAADEEEMDESADEEEMDESADEEEMDESADEEEMDENLIVYPTNSPPEEELEQEDSYSVEGDDEMPVQDKTDDLELDTAADDEDPVDAIQNAIAELEQALADLGASSKDEFDSDDAADKDSGMSADDMPMMGLGKDKDAAFEGRRVTREYVEKVAKENGPHAGAGTGETMSAPVEGVSPVSKGSGKPTSGAKAVHTDTKSVNQDGTKPHGQAGGFLSSAKEDNAGNQNVPGAKMGVKALKKVAKPGNNEGHAAGAGTGANSVKGATNTHSPLAK